MSAAPHPVPFHHAQHIGSLLRPQELLDTRIAYEQGKTPLETLRKAEDKAIADIVALQAQEVGIPCISDGEFRRHMFFDGFFDNLEGFTIRRDPPGEIFKMYVPDAGAFYQAAVKRAADTYICTGKIKRKAGAPSPYEQQFKSLASMVPQDKVPQLKIATASPLWFHLRHSSQHAFTKEAYPPGGQAGEKGYFADIATAYREELAALYKLGCRNVQVDDPLLAYFCDESMRKAMPSDGLDPDVEFGKYVDLYNDCFRDRPKDMCVGVHLCRGNFKDGHHFSQGAYDAIAEKLFRDLDADVYYLEYDTERAGTFTPLKHVPRSKRVVLGVVSSKLPQLEDPAVMEAKVRDAAAIMAKGAGTSDEEALQRLAISPQCGFASHSEGNNVQRDDMVKKLRLVCQVAGKIWPGQP